MNSSECIIILYLRSTLSGPLLDGAFLLALKFIGFENFMIIVDGCMQFGVFWFYGILILVGVLCIGFDGVLILVFVC